MLSKVARSLEYRRYACFYYFGKRISQRRLKYLTSKISILERPCCESEGFKRFFLRANKTGFSQRNFAATSDLIFSTKILHESNSPCEKCRQRANQLNKVFCYVDLDSLRKSKKIVETISNLRCQSKYILIGYTEGKNLSPADISPLLKIELSQIYIENLDFEVENKLTPLPIGFRDGFETEPSNFPMSEKYYRFLVRDAEKVYDANQILSHFSLWTHPEREILENIIRTSGSFRKLDNFKRREYKLPTGDISPKILFKEMSKHLFILAPRGGGMDTHRFYESIKAGAIPVVRKSNSHFDRIYEVFPCISLDSWSQLSKFSVSMEQKNKFLNRLRIFLSETQGLKIDANDLPKLFGQR